MKTRNLYCLFLAFVVVGCATLSHHSLGTRMGDISIGMNKQQVRQILGAPSEAATGRVYEGPAVTYPGASEVHRYLEFRKGATNDYIVVFNKDQVTEFGPYIGDLRARYGLFKP